jgi:predicted RNase H-like HicB family nuclease
MDKRFTPIFQRNGDWWIGHVKELTGANTQGRTLDAARKSLEEAVELVLDANREIAEKTHD